ncbi:hypothetical protein [Coleofasciculus sp.]|uniref:hypothetical protein n=1 Tax=Coleofasciculus sp. TaxID=3100458 RepID=UPI003A4A3863
MFSPSVPRNAYTDSPEQHPNLILGSLQLFFWIIFHPSAFCNHLKRIDYTLDFHHNRGNSLQWQNPKFWKLLFQVYFILPILANLILGLVLLALGASLNEIEVVLVLGVVGGVAGSMMLGATFAMMVSVAGSVAFAVALLCSEIVALKNEQEVPVRRLATVADVEAAIPEALSSGSFFFADIERNQVDELGLAILRFLAAQGEGVSIGKAALSRDFPDHLNPTLNLLLQRELIEDSGCGYGFQVELIRRWFARETGE